MDTSTIDNINKLTNAQLLRLEKEKNQALENEYKNVIYDRLAGEIEYQIDTNKDSMTLAKSKLSILENEYDIVDKVASSIARITIEKEIVSKSNDKITEKVKMNKYGKKDIEIRLDTEKMFIDVLNARFKNLELKEKLEKAVSKENAKEEYNQIYEYLDYLVKNAEGTIKNILTSLGTNEIKEIVARDLNLDNTPEFITLYNKAFKEIKEKYKDTVAYQSKANKTTDNTHLSIWWKMFIFNKSLKAILKI